MPKTPSNEPLSGDALLCAKIGPESFGIIVVRSVSTVPNIWGFVVFSGPHQIDPKSQIPLSPRPIKNTPGCLVRNPLEELLAAAVFVPIGRRYVGCYVRLPQSGVTRFCVTNSNADRLCDTPETETGTTRTPATGPTN